MDDSDFQGMFDLLFENGSKFAMLAITQHVGTVHELTFTEYKPDYYHIDGAAENCSVKYSFHMYEKLEEQFIHNMTAGALLNMTLTHMLHPETITDISQVGVFKGPLGLMIIG